MKVGGITLFPRIFLREKYRDILFYKKQAGKIIRHESIHIEQQKEVIILAIIILAILSFGFGLVSWYLIPLGYFSFYVWYFIEWVLKLFTPGNAYRGISFEREAYGNEMYENYIKNRERFAWIKYLWR